MTLKQHSENRRLDLQQMLKTVRTLNELQHTLVEEVKHDFHKISAKESDTCVEVSFAERTGPSRTYEANYRF